MVLTKYRIPFRWWWLLAFSLIVFLLYSPLSQAWLLNRFALLVTRQAIIAVSSQPPGWPFRIQHNICNPQVPQPMVESPLYSRQARLSGMLFLACGDVRTAEIYLEPLLLALPQDTGVIASLGAARLAAGREEEAIQVWNSHPSGVWRLLTYLADLAYMERNLPQSIHWLDLAQAFLSEPPSSNRLLLYYRACIAYRDANRHEEALAACQALVKIAPATAGHWMLLGRVYLQAQQYEEAEVSLQRALALKPDDGVFYFYLGQAYEGQGHLAAAWTAYENSVRLVPTYGWVRLRLADLEVARGNTAQAVAHLQVARHSEDAFVRQQAERRLIQLGVR